MPTRSITCHLLTCICFLVITQTRKIQSEGHQRTQNAAASTTAKWVDRLATKYYDSRSEFDKWSARTKDSKGSAEGIEAWYGALNGKTKEETSAIELLQFIGRYDPIWEEDRYLKSESEARVGRIKEIAEKDMEQWYKALEAVHEGGVSELWTVAFIVDVDRLFAKDGFQGKVSELLLGRLQTLPKDSVKDLANALNAGNAKAAVLIVQNEAFFNNSGFKQSSFDDGLKLLKERIASRKK